MAERRRVPVKKDKKPGVALPDFGAVIDRAQETLTAAECICPRLDRSDWHRVESDWSDITFLTGSVGAAMGVPIGWRGVRARLHTQATQLGATVPEDAMLLLGEGKLRRPVMLEVEYAGPPRKEIARPGGVAYSCLESAPLGQMKRVVAETVADARQRYGRRPDTTWLWYLTCHVCSGDRDFETLIVTHFRTA